MVSTSSVEIDTSKFPFDPSLCRSIANRLDYLYEISYVPKDSKIPVTDFPIVNPYTIFNKPQSSLKKYREHTHTQRENTESKGM